MIGVFQLFGLGFMKAYLIGADWEKKSTSGLEILFFGIVAIVIGTWSGSLFDQRYILMMIFGIMLFKDWTVYNDRFLLT